MLDDLLIRTQDMPDDMRILLDAYPRETWEVHPGFQQKTRHWLVAHQMFRRVSAFLRTEAEAFLDGSRAPEGFAARLSHYGGALVGNLHGHHGWEDHNFFPELSAADRRFDAGLEILENDHVVLNATLNDFTESANRVIKLVHLDAAQAHDEAGSLHGHAETIEALLKRHLTDEEELAVPIILHHRLRG